MADKEQPQAPAGSNVDTQTFSGGMIKDIADSFSKKGTYNHARNAVNNSHDGEQGTLSNEPANRLLAEATYPINGYAYMQADQWVIFSTDDYNCEIGLFDKATLKYSTIVNSPCLGFKQQHLIGAEVKKNFDCTYSAYWTDAGNPDRQMNLSHPPFKKDAAEGAITDACTVKYTTELDCAQLSFARAVTAPVMRLQKGHTSGTLLNGSYQCVMAYSVNGIRVTDYFLPSNAQSVFSHANLSGSIELTLDQVDTSYDEYELVIISNINLVATAKKLGYYSTAQKRVTIDYINQTLETVPLADITARSVIYEKSDSMTSVNNYLMRSGMTAKTDFNYQPQASKISTSWVALELPADYYHKGGNLTSYLRDEQQPFFIRWIYASSEHSADYPLVGRVAEGSDMDNAMGTDAFELSDETPVLRKKWQVENTATIESNAEYLFEGGRVIAEGKMGYWESTEEYPHIPAVWQDLCGKPIRHAKFPDNSLVPHMSAGGTKIVILGAKFGNITHPLDIDGNPIEGIVGYQILKASREGNKSIIAKGLINNTGQYDIPDGISSKKGLYTNYPYNDLRTDPFLSKGIVKGGCAGSGYEKMGTFKNDVFSFHSPDTQFRNPYLSATELKVYGEMTGTVKGNYEKVFAHPKHKIIRDFALIVAGLVGVGEGQLAVHGKSTKTHHDAYIANSGMVGPGGTVVPAGGAAVIANTVGDKILDAGIAVAKYVDLTGVIYDALQDVRDAKHKALGLTPGVVGGKTTTTDEDTATKKLPLPLRILNGAVLFSFYFSQGTEATLRIIKALVPYQQYALQYNSHGFYTEIAPVSDGNGRRKITSSSYLEPHLQDFADKYHVNNLFRGRQVIVELGKDLARPKMEDNTRQSISDRKSWTAPFEPFVSNTSAFYAALKIPIDNQYGQIDSMLLLPASTVIEPTTVSKVAVMTSSVTFGGDMYINRYTEKNTFFYFNDWMHNLVDGTEWDYNTHYNIPNPRYWINSQEYDVSQLTSGLVRLNFSDDALPDQLAHLDRDQSQCKTKISFVIKDAYFYLFNNSVRDFFVESEINLALRDHDDLDSQRHYDPYSYTDVKALFNSNIIKAGNHYKYDYSLSVSKLLTGNASWGQVLPRSYDPHNQKCYTYYPNRVVYSLQQQGELQKDNWLAFLANNKHDFANKVTAIREVHKSGAIFLFQNAAPMMFSGQDSLQTDGGIKLSIGDGGLFSQPMQLLDTTHRAYEYGSCQAVRSVENVANAIFWTSTESGKIFRYGKVSAYMESVAEISVGMKYWFSKYLPFYLLKDFPDFELKDNAVVGIATQTIYDNTNEVLYFTKKDYELKPEYKSSLVYIGGNRFTHAGSPVLLGDATYFNDASFTISYDTKDKSWVSYHDWHPDFLMAGKTHFMSVKGSGIWEHNNRCDLFCNFYGEDHPFEIEYTQNSGQEINTIRSLEYQLECFKYYNDCRDGHNILDENFDRLIVHNIEQISGLIKLQVKPRNSPQAVIQSTRSDSESISMYCSKEENKYRINGITDLTRDRGEFTGVERQIWITAANGYERQINPVNINYNKSVLQRKKMRHYSNKIFLRKNISGSSKMLLKIINTKLLKSER